MRDSGIPNESILIANRKDSYAEDAKSKGFIVEHDFEKAAAKADGGYSSNIEILITHWPCPVIFLLIPDQVQPRVFNSLFVPHLRADATIVVASGYNVLFKYLQFKPTYDVVMVAPRCISLHDCTDVTCVLTILKQNDRFLRPFALRERKGFPLFCFRRAGWHRKCLIPGIGAFESYRGNKSRGNCLLGTRGDNNGPSGR